MIVIDGVVGCGKSTLSDLLEKEGFEIFPEPVVDNPILEKFYYDKKRYSFPLQVFFLNKRFQHIKMAALKGNAVLDRGIHGDLLFAKILMEEGNMSKEEYDVYIELFHNMIEHCPQPKLVVYLEISTDEAIRRIQKRGRDYEQIVEREYWEKLNTNYREYFDGIYSHSPILKINVDNLDFENNEDDRTYILQRIKEALM